MQGLQPEVAVSPVSGAVTFVREAVEKDTLLQGERAP